MAAERRPVQFPLAGKEHQILLENPPRPQDQLSLLRHPQMERLKMAQMKQNQIGTVFLHGARIVSLAMDSRERLCLAQISNSLLKEFSYNEIHNRRVALGITCVQCTPVQLEILRRAGAMPISSRRCGMITLREAERLCKSFLGDNSPPRLPDSFSFEIMHECAWGCRGQFTPARYNSSRAKCIKCSFCSIFFSPNKFVFHSHRLAEGGKYIQPDAANFNSWRRHVRLLGDPQDEVVHAWEDVKAMFNGGTRKRMMSCSMDPPPLSPTGPSLHSSPPKTVKMEETLGLKQEVPQALSTPTSKEVASYLWPGLARPYNYHLLWPGRPLPSLPDLKDADPLASKLVPRVQEPFLGLFFANNHLSRLVGRGDPVEERREDTGVSQFMDGPFFRPGFRESAFQPFKREGDGEDREGMEKTSEEDCKEEEDSEGDEVVDIERIEDKEEDTALVQPTK